MTKMPQWGKNMYELKNHTRRKPKKRCYADKRLTRNDALELGLCWCCPSETGCTAL